MPRLLLLAALLLATGCTADLGPTAWGLDVATGATPPPAGGGGGAAPGASGPAFPVDRPPGGRSTDAACPVAYAGELEAEIAAVDDRLARDALAFAFRDLDRLGSGSHSARTNAASRLQALAQRLERQGDLGADQAARIADLAGCYLL